MPNRIIKESICTSDSIDKLSWFEEVLFYRLMVNCDDYGRYDGRPAIIKNKLFPLKLNLTLKAVNDAINALASAELVTLYEFEGKPYLYLPTWNEHQNVRAKKSKYPTPESGMITSANKCIQMQTDVPVIQSNTESNPIRNPILILFVIRKGDSRLLHLKRSSSIYKKMVITLMQTSSGITTIKEIGNGEMEHQLKTGNRRLLHGKRKKSRRRSNLFQLQSGNRRHAREQRKK